MFKDDGDEEGWGGNRTLAAQQDAEDRGGSKVVLGMRYSQVHNTCYVLIHRPTMS